MIRQSIKDKIIQLAKTEFPGLESIDFSVTETDSQFGDYATNFSMIAAKKLQENPRNIASKLAEELSKDSDFSKVEVAGPGFINFTLNPALYQKEITDILAQKEKFGHSDLYKDQKINIEFISANPTGPLTLGNGRNAYFGDTLGNVFSALGAKVSREYYVNDRGVQILALGHSVLKDSEAVYKGEYIDELRSKMKISEAGLPSEAAEVAKLGEEAAAIIMEEYIKESISKMGIKFDHWFSEKSLHDSGFVAETMEYLDSTGLTYKADDALWLKTTALGDDKDRVLVTKDGNHTYFASDIAYLFNKISRGYNLLINLLGADHHGYINRLQAATDILRKKTNWSGELKILICQLVRLISGGQEVRMSKRAGNYVLLDDLIDEIGPDVTRFFFLDRSLDTHMDFDLDLAKEKSDKNPVYYVQYAYARINSILAKVGDCHFDPPAGGEKSPGLLKQPEEIALIKKLIQLPEIVEEAAGTYQVQKLAFYSRDLATAFHNFYEKCPVIKAENEEIKSARIELLKATKIVLKNTLTLLGVSAPEKM